MISAKEAFIIGGLEITAGVVETIVIPNFGRKPGERFAIPAKIKIGKTALVLTGTGLAAGFTADFILDQLKVTQDQTFKRVMIITATVLSFNAMEAILVDNVVKYDFATEKWEMPTLRKFAANLGLLAMSSLLVGYFSNRIIGSLNPALSSSNDVSDVLVDKAS